MVHMQKLRCFGLISPADGGAAEAMLVRIRVREGNGDGLRGRVPCHSVSGIFSLKSLLLTVVCGEELVAGGCASSCFA